MSCKMLVAFKFQINHHFEYTNVPDIMQSSEIAV